MKLSQNYLKNSLSSLSPKGDRELRSQFKTPGFIILLVRKLQAGVGGPIARKPQVSSKLFYFFSYLWDFL
jgi:hypothetical protein